MYILFFYYNGALRQIFFLGDSLDFDFNFKLGMVLQMILEHEGKGW